MKHLSLVALSFCFLLSLASRAEAAKPVIIGWGEKISEISDLPKEVEMPGFKIGLHYNSFRVLFIPIVTWDKKLVIYSDEKNEYQDLDSDDIAELEKSVGSLSTKGGMGANWARYCNWVWPALIGLFIARKVIGGGRRGPIQET